MNKKKLYNRLITVTSIAIPVVVAILFRVRIPNVEPLDQLPPIYAVHSSVLDFQGFWTVGFP